MTEDIFEKQLQTAQKKINRKQRKTTKQIEAEIEDMEATIAKEPDKKKADEMDTMMKNYLEGFALGFRMGWLRERVEYEQD